MIAAAWASDNRGTAFRDSGDARMGPAGTDRFTGRPPTRAERSAGGRCRPALAGAAAPAVPSLPAVASVSRRCAVVPAHRGCRPGSRSSAWSGPVSSVANRRLPPWRADGPDFGRAPGALASTAWNTPWPNAWPTWPNARTRPSTPAARASRRAPPRQGEADRPGADRVPARRGLVPGARHAGPAPGPRHGARGQPALHRRCGDRLRHHRRPAGLPLQPGLHRLRRRPRRGLRREDPQGHGPGRLHRGAR